MSSNVPREKQIIPNGFHTLSRVEYESIQATNHSRLVMMEKSPAHFNAYPTKDDKSTAAQSRGELLALALLEPDVFLESVVVWRGGRRQSREWDAFLAAHEDKRILTEDEHRECIALSRAIRSHRQANRYLSEGRGEVTMVWQTKTGRRCKGRVDWICPDGTIVDIKSTRDGSSAGFARESWKYHVPSQSAWYHDGYESLTGVEPKYVLIVVEAQLPHVVTTYTVESQVLAAGRHLYNNWLTQLEACERSGEWPGYPPETALQLPPWVQAEGDES